MPETYVALDLETTGLDPATDAIIEVAAVKFQGQEDIATFSTLVQPDRPLPLRIRLLTGITEEELANAPSWSRVISELTAFLGPHTLIGHNLPFDLRFLAQGGMALSNPRYDTLELTSILLPTLPQRNLGAVAEHLAIPYRQRHRAQPDALTAKEVFWALRERARRLDGHVLAALSQLAPENPWPLRPFFQNVLLEQQGSRPLHQPQQETDRSAPLVAPDKEADQERLGHPPTLQFLDVEALASLLGEGGALARTFTGFEHRPEQVRMLRAVAEAFNQGHHVLAEAGTGTGKSIAYLLPAILFALQNRTPVVVSTHTLNLQAQLVEKDIPDLLQALQTALEQGAQLPSLGSTGGEEALAQLRVVQLKGRSNYLCPRRWSALAASPALSRDEVGFLARLQVWLAETDSGDRGELTLNSREATLWHRVSAQGEECVASRCGYGQGAPSASLPTGQAGSGRAPCFLQKARRRAAAAHLVVVNHALLLSDLVSNRSILPDSSYLIVDEAHHLEEATTECLGFQTGPRALSDCLARLSDPGRGAQPRGLLPRLALRLNGAPLSLARQGSLIPRLEALEREVGQARSQAEHLSRLLSHFLQQSSDENGDYGRRVRLTAARRHLADWEEIEVAWERMEAWLRSVEAGLVELASRLEVLDGVVFSDRERALEEIAGILYTTAELCQRLSGIIAHPNPEEVCWLASGGLGEGATMYMAPLHVGEVLERELFSPKSAVILTSATLTTDGSFSYMKERLGVDYAGELVVEAPFDYLRSTLLCLPQDFPLPDAPGYQAAMEEALLHLFTAAQGRALVLFTSHGALQMTYTALRERLEALKLPVLAQGIHGQPHQLLEAFKQQKGSVLLGTSSFWEGVDVVGEALSLLVIPKLPFTVPTEPVFAARSELFEDPFNQYALPQAILRFRQGFGRLIRSQRDRGALVVLDRRLQNRRYGVAFLRSLPTCTVLRGPMAQIPAAVAQWLQQS